jgi:hypothetical protein
MYPKVKIINKMLMSVQWREGESRHVMPNLFEAAKAFCVAHAKGLAIELPYFVGVLDHRLAETYPQLGDWYSAFTSDNPPQKVSFQGKADKLKELIEPIDFFKPYDATLAESIRSQFTTASSRRAVDAQELLEAELFSADES